jgi:3-oxoacyl-ACP reductase-like protein
MAGLIITGNGQVFADEQDLTDETRDSLLDAFEEAVAAARGTGAAMSAAVAAVDCVRQAALSAGWTPVCAERLAVIAAVQYGAILGQVALAAADCHRRD